MHEKRDSLGDRMKGQYEDRTRYMLPRRSYCVIRVDGKAFHTYTRGCEKPNDKRLAECMDVTAMALCEKAQGAQFAYVQSDEISVLLTDFALPTTDAWFDGNLQKVCSVSASIATAAFNEKAAEHVLPSMALFDSRVFCIPDPVEVENYFIWRQQDATRNSIQGLLQANFSPKQCHGVNMAEAQEMLFAEKGINWNDEAAYWKRGRCIVKADQGWRLDSEIPVFTKERDYLASRIPRAWAPPVDEKATQG